MERKFVYLAIDSERDYQDQKWAGTETQEHEIASFILYMEHHLAAARAIASTESPENGAMEHLRKVVSLGVKCMEVYGVTSRDNPNQY